MNEKTNKISAGDKASIRITGADGKTLIITAEDGKDIRLGGAPKKEEVKREDDVGRNVTTELYNLIKDKTNEFINLLEEACPEDVTPVLLAAWANFTESLLQYDKDFPDKGVKVNMDKVSAFLSKSFENQEKQE